MHRSLVPWKILIYLMHNLQSKMSRSLANKVKVSLIKRSVQCYRICSGTGMHLVLNHNEKIPPYLIIHYTVRKELFSHYEKTLLHQGLYPTPQIIVYYKLLRLVLGLVKKKSLHPKNPGNLRKMIHTSFCLHP